MKVYKGCQQYYIYRITPSLLLKSTNAKNINRAPRASRYYHSVPLIGEKLCEKYYIVPPTYRNIYFSATKKAAYRMFISIMPHRLGV